MKRGMALDALIAEKVMGWKWRSYRWYDDSEKELLWHKSHGEPEGDDFARLGKRLVPWDLPQFSTDIAAALEIERVLSEKGWFLELIRLSGGWRVNFRQWRPRGKTEGAWFEVSAFGHPPNPDTNRDHSGRGYAALAICLAALKVLEAG
jgi:hypothetical protein